MITPISFTDFYNSVWNKIPEVWRDADQENGRPLQIFVLTISQQLYYYFYLKIAALDDLFDPDTCPEKYLPFLASMLGWKLIGTDSESKRKQLRAAPLLYKIKGTRKGITLAEKLVGYSVFMTELYRDYTGQFVQKDRIFNSLPPSIKIKPWFRRNVVQDDLGVSVDTFSDIFQSYIEGKGHISDDGVVIIPRQFRKVSSTIVTTVLPSYDYKTGLNSLVRFSKVPRLNVILKKDKELDESENVLTEAINLFLSFKPFHLFINNLEIRYSLSDYGLGCERIKNPGTGLNPEDIIFSRESSNISVNIQNQIEEIEYLVVSEESSTSSNIDVISNSDIKGCLQFNYIEVGLASLEKETDTAILDKLGFSYKGYAKNFQTSNGSSFWNSLDFSFQALPGQSTFILLDNTKSITINDVSLNHNTDVILNTPYTAKIVLENKNTCVWTLVGGTIVGSNSTAAIDFVCSNIGTGYATLTCTITDPTRPSGNNQIILTSTLTLLSASRHPIPNFSFRKFLYPQYKPTSLKSIFSLTNSDIDSNGWYSTAVTDATIRSGYFNDSVQVNGKTYTKLFYDGTRDNPISLFGVSKFLARTPSAYRSTMGTISSPISLALNTPLEVVRDVVKHNIIATVYDTYTGLYALLDPTDIKYDYTSSSFIFNTYSILTKLASNISDELSNSININNCFLSILYPEIVNNEQSFTSGDIKRNSTVSTIRQHSKFNRITFQDSSALTTYLETSSYVPQYFFNTITGELELDTNHTRLFKQPLSRLFTRNSLHKEMIGINSMISYNNRDSRNEAKWKVYAEPAQSLYLNSEPITRGWWANYFNVPAGNTSDVVNYTDIPTDYNTQMSLRKSIRWNIAQSNINYSDPTDFLATRTGHSERNKIWNRGSATVSPIPYIGYSRDFIQTFRGDTALFNRVSNLDPHSISLADRSNLSYYKYTQNGIDYTNDYLNPAMQSIDNIIPLTEPIISDIKTVTRLSTDIGKDYGILYPTKEHLGIISEYNYPTDFTSADTYYVDKLSTQLKPSFYANNIKINELASNKTLSESSDGLDFNLFGLSEFTQFYTITSPTDSTILLNNRSFYIIWREVNTGKFIGSGYYCLAPSANVRPNLRVFLNGLEQVYNEAWVISNNPAKLTLLTPVAETDIIEIKGFVQNPEIIDPNVAYDLETGAVLALGTNTISHTDSITLAVTPEKMVNYQVSFSLNPVVYWRRVDTNDFCNISMSRTSTVIVPKPLIYQNIAYPDTQVVFTPISTSTPVTLEYMVDWIFTADPLSVPSYKIVLLSHRTHVLQIGDTIEITYIALTS